MDATRRQILVLELHPAPIDAIRTTAASERFDVSVAPSTGALLQADAALGDLILIAAGTDIGRALGVLDLLARAGTGPDTVVLSADTRDDTAVRVIAGGAAACLPVPLDADDLARVLRAVRRREERRRELLALESVVARQVELCGMVGRSPQMQTIFERIRRVAPYGSAALLEGEPGTGKTLAAHALHRLGPSPESPFLKIEGGTIVPAALDSMSAATLYVTNVEAASPAAQAALLAFANRGRVIAATTTDLAAESAAGRFDAALLQRLSVCHVALPPLRARREDLPYLTATFLQEHARRAGAPAAGLTPDAERLLYEQPWSGNVAQLRQCLERAAALGGQGLIGARTVAACLRDGRRHDRPRRPLPGPAPAATPLAVVQREHIIRTLRTVRGNKAVAARLLGISRRAFYRQLERHGLHHRVPEAPRQAPPQPHPPTQPGAVA